MKRFTGKLATSVGIAAAIVGLAFATALPAYADTGSATFEGTGTISPGLTTTPAYQVFEYTGTADISDATDPAASGTYHCQSNGDTETATTLVSGHGTFNVTCSGMQGQGWWNWSGTYTLAAGAVTVSGNATPPDDTATTFTGSCAFVPTSSPTDVTSFVVMCQIVFQ